MKRLFAILALVGAFGFTSPAWSDETVTPTEAATQVARKTNPATLYRLIETLNRISPYGRHTLNVRMQVEYLLTEYLGFWQNKENTG